MEPKVCLPISFVCLIAFAAVAAAQGNCSLQSAVGTNAVIVNGYFGTVPYVALGTVKVKADGTSTGKTTVATPSGSFEQSSTGTVTVNPDCTMTKVYPGFTEEGLILRNGEETRVMVVNPLAGPLGPRVQTNTGYRMAAGANDPHCASSMVAGTYGQYCTGRALQGPAAGLPLGFLGQITLDGAGHFTGSGVVIVGGQKLTLMYEDGAYTLNPDCTGSASFKFVGQPGTWTEKIVVFDQGKEMISITTSGQQIDTCRFTRMDR